MMLEPTLFAGLDHHVHDRVAELHATVAEIRPPRADGPNPTPGLMTRTRGTVGRFLVSLGSQVAGQPQA